MLTLEQQRTYVGHCGACRSTLRPELIPWTQHSIGCPVRECELAGRVERWQAQLERIHALPECADAVSPSCNT